MKSYHVAAAQKSTPANRGEIFYSATRNYIPVGSLDNFIISSKADGTGLISVDDEVIITIEEQGIPANSVTYKHDYSNGCSGVVRPTNPVNLNAINPDFNKFKGKMISITIEFSDICGGLEHGSDYYLVLES